MRRAVPAVKDANTRVASLLGEGWEHMHSFGSPA